MIRLPAAVFVASAPVNLHLSFDRLGGIVRDVLGREPRSDAAFVFHNRKRTHVKILWHDGRGYCLAYKRLDRGTYRIPLAVPPGAAEVALTLRELAALFEGVDERLLRRARQIAKESRAAAPARGCSGPTAKAKVAPARGAPSRRKVA